VAGRLFGTDGVRGLANDLLTPELALAVAGSAVAVLGRGAGAPAGERPVAVLGRDPRASGEMLAAAVTAGLTAAGADVLDAGVVPTPALAHLVGDTGADFGVMISASHNAMPDNGIKLFGRGGVKLTDAQEDAVEAGLGERGPRPTGAGIGRSRTVPDAAQRYLAHLAAAVPTRLDGLRVVVDCAHGAASATAPAAYRAAGADVVAIAADPDGLNINDGVGSTHLDGLRAAVLEHGADLGVAHDGDADRCLAVDATGAVVDGDAILGVLAVALHEAGGLAEGTLVTTVMSNLGLHLAMRDAGIAVRTTAVGDRYVLEELRAGGYSLGGEQSGHVVLPAHASTGDGTLTALALMARVVTTGRPLAELAAVVTPLPQVLLNVPVTDKAAVAQDATVRDAVSTAEQELGDTGRVLLRPSGTEQLVRVMVEAPTAEQAGRVAARLAERVGAVGVAGGQG
jgi:phosphoglucosamine mutase